MLQRDYAANSAELECLLLALQLRAQAPHELRLLFLLVVVVGTPI